MIRDIPVSSNFLGDCFMLRAARKGDIINPASDAAVTIWPALPTVVLNVSAISVNMKPIKIPIGLVESCDMNSDGTSSPCSLLGSWLII